MRIVLGVLEPDAGEVRWRGRPCDAAARARGVGVVASGNFSLTAAMSSSPAEPTVTAVEIAMQRSPADPKAAATRWSLA